MRRLDHVKLAGAVDIDPGHVPVRMDGVELRERRGNHRRIPQDLKGLSGGLGAPVVEIRAVVEDPVSRGVLAKVPACTPHGFRPTFATSLREAGTDLHLVRSAFGREDIESRRSTPRSRRWP
jgi:integrase